MGRLNKSIKELAQRLPKTYREASRLEYEEVFNARSREVKNNVLEGQGFEIISDNPEYIVKKGVKFIEVNHEKKIRKAFKEGGNEAVTKYLNWVNENNIYLNQKYKIKFEMDAIKNILKQKMNTIFS